MGIPQFTHVSQYNVKDTSLINTLSEWVNQTDTPIHEFIRYAKEFKGPILLNEDGTLNLGQVLSRAGNPPDWNSRQIIMDRDDIAGFANMEIMVDDWIKGQYISPAIDTFIDGIYTIYVGRAAINFYQQYLIGFGKPETIPSPVLYLTGGDFTPSEATANEEGMAVWQTTAFCSTFKTQYGEGPPSNIITGTNMGWTSVSLAVEVDSVPSNIVSVCYYRSFGTEFKKVAEVLTGK